MSLFSKYIKPISLCGLLAFSLSACENFEVTGPDTFDRPNDKWQQRDKQRETVFGEGGLTFGGADAKRQGSQGGGIGVNAYLWRATLDTISFMPLASADPFGGVVLTDWHNPDNSGAERFKLNVYILGQALRSDGIRVAAFRQVKQGEQWVGAAIDPKIITDIENSILTRARQLRSDSMTQ